MEKGHDVRAVREIEGWEDKQTESRRENMIQCAFKICPVFVYCLVVLVKHILSVINVSTLHAAQIWLLIFHQYCYQRPCCIYKKE